ncbi:Gfo/Idh/MocA family protein [Halomarina ordinaria]|uniref:Gfo/Idh/MocA family protein n=1 Tax=Halomarina ordinaria TaxID=3033939 RepID=A0ABD5UFZ9_9EURY|nr:Gfo/Idh/MocA family oxidoreductase [Halomarina sp. PSRA2]
MARSLRLGLLGVGHIGTVHLQSASTLDGVDVVAAADAVPGNRRRAERLGVTRTYDDYTDLLEEESLDAVVVALPPFLHADATVAACEAGCAVFVEKPFARTPEEGRRMVEAADAAGVALGVDHTIRYQPEMKRLKERFEDGRLGHVPIASISRINNGPFEAPPARAAVPTWQLDPEATGGGALMDLGIHLLDVLEWFFGDLTVEHATTDQQLDLPYEDAATVVVSTDSGTTATLSCGFFQWETPPEVTSYLRLDGIAGSAVSTEYVPGHFTSYAARSALENLGRRLRGDDPEYFKPTYYYQAHYWALRDFLEAVAAGERPPVDGAAGLRMVEHVHEAYRLADADAALVEVTE